jgi:hypothetical protein
MLAAMKKLQKREYVAPKSPEYPCVITVMQQRLSGFAGTAFAMKLIERQCGIAAWRFGAPLSDIAQSRWRQSDLGRDLGLRKSGLLQVFNALCP